MEKEKHADWWSRGYTAIINYVLVDQNIKLTNSDLRVLAYIAYRSGNGKYKVKVMNRTIAKHCKVSLVTVHRALIKLTKYNLINRTVDQNINNNRTLIFNIQAVNESTLDLPWTEVKMV